MSVIDEVLAANEQYAREHKPNALSPKPTRRLAILTCMDTRLTQATMGLRYGDAHIIRNAGGIVTDDALRSLLVSHFLLGTEEFMIINHTDCGQMRMDEETLRHHIESRTGTAVISPATFHTFTDVEHNVRRQLQKLESHPWITKEVKVRGFVFDVKTGRLREVHL